MASGLPQPDEFSEPSLAEFASELTATADDVVHALTARPDGPNERKAGRGEVETLDLHRIMRIPVTMKVVVGAVTLPVAELKALRKGEVVSLDRRVGEAVDIVVNGEILARGMLVIVDPTTARLGVSLTELVDRPPGTRVRSPAERT